MDEALQFLNNRRSSIVWEETSRGRSVDYLDLTVSLEPSGISYRTFRKHTNKYLHVPRYSCHPASVFRSVIASETSRLFYTNKSKEDFDRELDFFVKKLVLRGYSKNECLARPGEPWTD